MKKSRVIMLIVVLLLTVSLVGVAMASDNTPQSPDANGSRSGTPDTTPPVVYFSPASFSQGFDDVTNLPNWYMQNNSNPLGTNSWFQGNSGVFPAQAGAPTAYIGANFNSTTGVGTISNWLLTPQLAFANGASFSFWTRTPTGSLYPDRLQVRLSTAGSSTNVGTAAEDVGDFTLLLLDVNPTLAVGGYPEVWTKYTIVLSGIPQGSTGRLAFRYYVTNGGDGGYSNYIGIDTVEFTDAPPIIAVTPTSLHATQLPGKLSTQHLNICNYGTADLSWNITEVSGTLGSSMPFVPVKVSQDNLVPEGLTVSSGTNQIGTPPGAEHPEAVLWDQPLSSVNQSAFVDQDFPDFSTYTSFLADDFTNASSWLISGIYVPGDGWGTFTTLMNATTLTWQIYADNGGVPDGDPTGGGNPPLWTMTLPPSDPKVVITTGTPGGFPSNTKLNLTSPINLPPGHYWLVFYPTMGFTCCGQFGRQPADTTNGFDGQVINPGGGFGFGTVWTNWSVLSSSPGGDIAFRLEGEVSNYDIPWLSETPITGTTPGAVCTMVDVNFNSAGLAIGDYMGGLHINSNDPADPIITVPVRLTVGYNKIFLPMTQKH